MGHVRDLRNERKIISPERIGLLPLLAIFVDATELHVVPKSTAFDFIAPDHGLDSAKPDFMGGFVFSVCHRRFPLSALSPNMFVQPLVGKALGCKDRHKGRLFARSDPPNYRTAALRFSEGRSARRS